MAFSATPGALHLSAGVLVGFGMGGASSTLTGAVTRGGLTGAASGVTTEAYDMLPLPGSDGQFSLENVALETVIGGATGSMGYRPGADLDVPSGSSSDPLALPPGHQPLALPAGSPSVPRGADFVAGPPGSQPPVPVSQSRMRDGLEAAGFPSQPTSSAGTQYTLPDGSHVRLMEPSGQAPLRASFTNANGGPVDPFTNKPVQPPRGLTKPERMEYIRDRTHVEQVP